MASTGHFIFASCVHDVAHGMVLGTTLTIACRGDGNRDDGERGNVDMLLLGAPAADFILVSCVLRPLSVWPYVLLPRLCPKQRRQASHLELVTSDGAVARKWATAINNILGGVGEPESISEEQGSRIRSRRSVGPGRRLLVLINPISGRGRSLSIWKNTLR